MNMLAKSLNFCAKRLDVKHMNGQSKLKEYFYVHMLITECLVTKSFRDCPLRILRFHHEDSCLGYSCLVYVCV